MNILCFVNMVVQGKRGMDIRVRFFIELYLISCAKEGISQNLMELAGNQFMGRNLPTKTFN